MSTSLKWRTAELLFQSGQALFEENRYEQALLDLRKAEEAFRKLEARGHPYGNALSNGISGLSNTLGLLGRCYQKLGNFEQATICYETSLINAKFEKAKPFQTFITGLSENLAACYEKELAKLDEQTLQGILNQDIAIDANFRFPFSLSKNAIPLARLYELVPNRYPLFREFYQRATEQNTRLRKLSKSSDESTIKKMTVYVWGILLLIWLIYGFIAINALMRNN